MQTIHPSKFIRLSFNLIFLTERWSMRLVLNKQVEFASSGNQIPCQDATMPLTKVEAKKG